MGRGSIARVNRTHLKTREGGRSTSTKHKIWLSYPKHHMQPPWLSKTFNPIVPTRLFSSVIIANFRKHSSQVRQRLQSNHNLLKGRHLLVGRLWKLLFIIDQLVALTRIVRHRKLKRSFIWALNCKVLLRNA